VLHHVYERLDAKDVGQEYHLVTSGGRDLSGFDEETASCDCCRKGGRWGERGNISDGHGAAWMELDGRHSSVVRPVSTTCGMGGHSWCTGREREGLTAWCRCRMRTGNAALTRGDAPSPMAAITLSVYAA
jgi:hypothetical protein